MKTAMVVSLLLLCGCPPHLNPVPDPPDLEHPTDMHCGPAPAGHDLAGTCPPWPDAGVQDGT